MIKYIFRLTLHSQGIKIMSPALKSIGSRISSRLMKQTRIDPAREQDNSITSHAFQTSELSISFEPSERSLEKTKNISAINFALHKAVELGNYEDVKFAIEQGAQANNDYNSLHEAYSKHNTNCLKRNLLIFPLLLRQLYTNINQVNERGTTALHNSVPLKDSEMLKIFLEHPDIDVNYFKNLK